MLCHRLTVQGNQSDSNVDRINLRRRSMAVFAKTFKSSSINIMKVSDQRRRPGDEEIFLSAQISQI